MANPDLVMGIDFGSDSVRALVVDATTGKTAGEGVAPYRRWTDGLYCDPGKSRFRQHPLDYLESLETACGQAVAAAGPEAGKRLRGVCVDSTGSTPAPVDETGRPLALRPEFADNPNAMFFLWKDHAAVREAAEINAAAETWDGEDFLRYQGLYSSEWFWAKILKAVRDDAAVRDAAWTWIEECEWITAELCGLGPRFARSACAAGHKALWHGSFGGLPARAFLAGLDPHLGLVHDRFTPPLSSDQAVGKLSPPWRERWKTGDDVVVAGGLFDAHAGAVACGVRSGTLVKIIGTSAVDMLVEKAEAIRAGDTKHLFGMAENSIVPGLVGIEAGQAAFGDVFRWFETLLGWRGAESAKADGSLLARLNEACADKPPSRVVALDWFNGRRYPRANDEARACVANLDLGVDAPALYQALVTGVAFGARRMLDGFVEAGITVNDIVCAGGVAKKAPFVMQTLADVLEREVAVSASGEACAKGAAMFAALAAGLHPSLAACQDAMGDGVMRRYAPRTEYRDAYARLFAEYIEAGDFMERRR